VLLLLLLSSASLASMLLDESPLRDDLAKHKSHS
jgi:hypothetical protein